MKSSEYFVNINQRKQSCSELSERSLMVLGQSLVLMLVLVFH